jgi:hypothetical protein
MTSKELLALRASKAPVELIDDLRELEARLKIAEEAHAKAKDTFSRFEGSPQHTMWETLRDEVDHTLTHEKILRVMWHRINIEILES